jgi:hypothetical protein
MQKTKQKKTQKRQQQLIKCDSPTTRCPSKTHARSKSHATTEYKAKNVAFLKF